MTDQEGRQPKPVWGQSSHALIEFARFIAIGGLAALVNLVSRYLLANPFALFLAGGVDVVLTGHEHSVELTWPVRAGAATQLNYDAPAAPVHIIAGAAGCNEQHGDCLNPMGPAAGAWSRARLAGDPQQYGYSRFWALNATHWHFEQVQTSLPGGPALWSEAVDIVQPRHGPFQA
jgi:hypothetical protein